MNKKEFLHIISEKTNLSNGVAEMFLDATIDALQIVLCAGDEINLPGLGKFEVKKRKARAGRNPATGAAIQIEAKIMPRFKCSSTLMNLLNEKK